MPWKSGHDDRVWYVWNIVTFLWLMWIMFRFGRSKFFMSYDLMEKPQVLIMAEQIKYTSARLILVTSNTKNEPSVPKPITKKFPMRKWTIRPSAIQLSPLDWVRSLVIYSYTFAPQCKFTDTPALSHKLQELVKINVCFFGLFSSQGLKNNLGFLERRKCVQLWHILYRPVCRIMMGCRKHPLDFLLLLLFKDRFDPAIIKCLGIVLSCTRSTLYYPAVILGHTCTLKRRSFCLMWRSLLQW